MTGQSVYANIPNVLPYIINCHQYSHVITPTNADFLRRVISGKNVFLSFISAKLSD